jgi:hypothetical protein
MRCTYKAYPSIVDTGLDFESDGVVKQYMWIEGNALWQQRMVAKNLANRYVQSYSISRRSIQPYDYSLSSPHSSSLQLNFI